MMSPEIENSARTGSIIKNNLHIEFFQTFNRCSTIMAKEAEKRFGPGILTDSEPLPSIHNRG